MNIEKKLAAVMDKWKLLNHPFYQSWSAGTLPVEALQVYAREYGSFIETLPAGWSTLGDPETAAEEEQHARLWQDFTGALGAKPGSPEIAQTTELVRTAAEAFGHAPQALGALYAFEVQQPDTAQSKLQGLKTWYSLPPKSEPYFEVHSNNAHESRKILAQIESLSAADQDRAVDACGEMAEALWDALSGIYEKTCMKS